MRRSQAGSRPQSAARRAMARRRASRRDRASPSLVDAKFEPGPAKSLTSRPLARLTLQAHSPIDRRPKKPYWIGRRDAFIQRPSMALIFMAFQIPFLPGEVA